MRDERLLKAMLATKIAQLIERFLVSVRGDKQKLDLISNRIRESYFSGAIPLGKPVERTLLDDWDYAIMI